MARRLWPVVLLLAAAPAWPQLLEAERTVELVLAESESQARVVGRAMRTGFLIDQLLIPETSYIGRFPWSRLSPSQQDALRDARPGEPHLLTLSSGKHVVARVLPSGPPALLGETRFGQDSQDIWAVISVGPTDSRLLSMEVDVDTEDLAAICRSKQRLIEGKLQATRAQVAALPPEADPQALIGPYGDLISLLSFEGEMAAAIQAVGALVERLPAPVPTDQRSYRDTMHLVLGLLELRRGEVDNCLRHHHREMCLFPLSEAARHKNEDGAGRAFEHFSRFLDRHPDDLEVRWLLNIAAMTLGTYADRVRPKGDKWHLPQRLRIGPESFASTVDPGRFWDVAHEAGIAYSDNAGGSVVDDFDGDRLLDLVVSSRDPCEPLRLYLNRGGDGPGRSDGPGADGRVTFADVTEAAGLRSQLGGLNVTQADYDGDGRLDLFVLRGGWETAIRNSLLRNREAPGGGVVFEDVTDRAGLGGPGHRTQSAAWADYDGDGRLDVFVGNEFSFSQLFRNRGPGADGVVTFEDVTLDAGLRFRSMTKGVTWGDVNNDGRPDLYVSNFGERNLLFVNRGAGADGTVRFDEVGRERGVSEPIYSFTTWFWDYDNDGWQDLLAVTLLQTVDEVAREYLGLPQRDETLRIYRNRGDGRPVFEDTTAALGMARNIPTMGANFGDLDNDGYPDVYLGTGAPSYGMLIPNRMFLNRGGRGFVDVTTATGTGHLQKGHGVAFADLDNDGDEDILANMGGAFPGDKYPNALFENPGHGNDWIAVELAGRRSNRFGVGARIRVVLDRGGKEEQRFRWVTSGGSFGASPLMQHIGLGRGARIPRLEIDWPVAPRGAEPEDAPDRGARRQVVRDVPVNSFLVVTEGVSGFELATRPRLTLGSGAAAETPHRHH